MSESDTFWPHRQVQPFALLTLPSSRVLNANNRQVQPFASLIMTVPASTPRVLLNREAVGMKEMNDNGDSLTGGFRFGREPVGSKRVDSDHKLIAIFELFHVAFLRIFFGKIILEVLIVRVRHVLSMQARTTTGTSSLRGTATTPSASSPARELINKH